MLRRWLSQVDTSHSIWFAIVPSRRWFRFESGNISSTNAVQHFLFFFHSNNITNFIVLFIYLLHCTKTIIWNFIKGKLHVLICLCLFIIVFMSSDITRKYMYMFPVANLWAHFFNELWSKSRKIWKTESWAGPAYEARSYCKGTCFPLTELT